LEGVFLGAKIGRSEGQGSAWAYDEQGGGIEALAFADSDDRRS